MLRAPPASLLAMLSGDNESELFYAAVNTQEHDPRGRRREVGKGSEGPERRRNLPNSKEKNEGGDVRQNGQTRRRDLVKEFGGERGEKEEKRKDHFPLHTTVPS